MTTESGLLVLQHHATCLTLDPRRGGTLHGLRWRDYELLRRTPPGAGADPLETACFPMVPFANRIARGRFAFGDREVRIPGNWRGDPHPIHGQAWREPWSVVARDSSWATLRYEGGGDDWPWRYRCEQHLVALKDGVRIELSIENVGAAPMPAMLGLHPYFPDASHAVLEATLPRVWLTDAEALPLQEVPTPAAWRFDPPRSVTAQPLDHGFTGWDGRAVLRWPDRLLTLEARHCGALHVYVPAGRDFWCLEPQTAAPGALSRGEATPVPPGGRLAIRMTLRAQEA